MAISGTPWNIGESNLNVRNAEWMVRRCQKRNHRSPANRVALIDSPKKHFDKFVKIIKGLEGLQFSRPSFVVSV